MNGYSQLIDHLTANGLIVKSLQFDSLERVPTQDKPNKLNGWYIAFNTPVMMVVYGNWATGETDKYISKDRLLSKRDFVELHQQIERAKKLREQAQANQWEINRQKLEATLKLCYPIKGTPAELYLNNRGITKTDHDSLLYHPHLVYCENNQVSTYPALIAKVTSPDGELITLHRTYITKEGFKADVSTPKKLMRTAGKLSGASIKLGEPINSPNGLLIGISEGIETALSATEWFDIPTWSVVSAGGIRAFEPPPEVKRINFYSDNDEVGINASKLRGKELASRGLLCKLIKPLTLKDWNDVLIAGVDE